ncbi:tetratricopeptide repeat-containing glycosyltransferase [Paraburkholderia silvatlantica]|uniref:Glycosyl transferase family 2 n=1 Tax=Paraburkholderia silvatlantica TaxID=321895 RepID=A0A2V4THY1_9BURK|nr:glycosyltransferase [Paraburkholderia silvatlantica]PYE13162.1 glycosyl transferase family 2 [Paraburkholderia silvatlantica]TDQ76056.1 glycosyl transferase family 2 [Paraburkholderia silvatlantica]
MKKICLNMIVKNEAPVIARCLASVKPWIDHWMIVDTGSSDGTQDIVRKCMEGVTGELHERVWRDFAHNRNEALALAKPHGDYILFIDADETLEMDSDFRWPLLSADGYQFRCKLGDWQYQRNALVAANEPWRWEGVLHEYLTQYRPHTWVGLPGPTIVVSRDGARARNPATYLRDIEVLERATSGEPDNCRYRFYLAQSYRDAGLLERSICVYRERYEMGGWEEERWFSLYQIATLLELHGAAASEVRDTYLAAYQARPHRAEPLYRLAMYYRLRDEYALAHLFAQQAASIAHPTDLLFVDESVYAWRALDELVVSAYYVGAIAQGRAALHRLLQEQKFPPEHRQRIEGNRQYFGL